MRVVMPALHLWAEQLHSPTCTAPCEAEHNLQVRSQPLSSTQPRHNALLFPST